MMNKNSIFYNFRKRVWGVSKEDPYEFFDHYTVFSYWVVKHIYSRETIKKY